jgi:hypothetical protein
MPAGSPWATFNKARKTGITRSTKALEELYVAKPAALVALAGKANGFRGLPNAVKTALQGKGLSPVEIDHIKRWPNGQKEDVRKALLNANSSGPGHAVLYRWKLHDGSREITVVDTGANQTTITFYSPWSKVRAVAADNVTVDVN